MVRPSVHALLALTLLGAFVLPASSQAQDRSARLASMPRLAVEETASGPAAAILTRAADLPVPVMARVTAALDADGRALDERLTTHRVRKRPVWLAIAVPATVDAVDGWR